MSLLAPGELERAGLPGRVASRWQNPLVREESVLRTSMLPGMLRAVAFNASRQQPRRAPVRDRPRLPEAGDRRSSPCPTSASGWRWPSRVGAATPWARRGCGASSRARSVSTGCGLGAGGCARTAPDADRAAARAATATTLGVVGEVDPRRARRHGIDGRVGWIDCDLERLLTADRRSEQAQTGEPVPVERHRPGVRGGGGHAGGCGRSDAPRGGGPVAGRACACSTSTEVPAWTRGTRSLAYRLAVLRPRPHPDR